MPPRLLGDWEFFYRTREFRFIYSLTRFPSALARSLFAMSDLYLSHLRHWILRLPPAEWLIKGARELLIGTLRQGPIPQHVAFEMDGNRRFAKNHKIEAIEGHNLGFEALARVRPRILQGVLGIRLAHLTYVYSHRSWKFATSPGSRSLPSTRSASKTSTGRSTRSRG